MDDLISRQAAIDRINGTGYADQIKNNLILILRMLPPAAQPDFDAYCEKNWKKAYDSMEVEHEAD